jgi:hypothetical protein
MSLKLKSAALGLAAVLVLAAPAVAGPGATGGVVNAALAQAGRAAPLRAIDYGEDRCDERTVEQWLVALSAGQARSIAWHGGPCRLVGPGIDSGSRWCAHGLIVLRMPEDRDDRPMVEVFFEAPERRGRPGRPYAFRGALRTADGDDVIRFRREFEAAWASRFPTPAGAVVDCDGG